jgi:hypothetical protein
MAKKKRSNNVQELKQQKARKKKEFMSKLLMVCKVISDESLFYIMPEAIRSKVYATREVIDIRGAKGVKIQKRLLEVIEKTIKQQLLDTQMELIAGSGRTVSFSDYMKVVSSLEASIRKDYPEQCFEGMERFDDFLAEKDRRINEFEGKIMDLCSMACNIFDDLSQARLYSYALAFETHPEKVQTMLNSHLKQHLMPRSLDEFDFKLHNIITIGTYPLDVKKVTIKGDTRPVIQMATLIYPTDVFVFMPFEIAGEDLNIGHAFSQLKIPVYIQQHAINRVMERSGYRVPGLCKIDILSAVFSPVITRIGKDRFLIEYRMNKIKIGYLVAEFIDGILVVITFLLMTNNGTPEGDKLAELTGLKKLDKEYLMIDNLRSLASSDILESEIVCKLFCDAGCQSILEACTLFKDNKDLSWMMGIGEQKNSMSEMIIEYLKPDADNEEYVEGEE